ncbi:MAG: hypothetical protein CVV44_01940 [Spirochaetae bacterium HGW-Spirochaetae-1]|nr:MAG: hypothetical protein CVV44_01940 [Spirochaetae bacterium HGW-Spirochaetae-1]
MKKFVLMTSVICMIFVAVFTGPVQAADGLFTTVTADGLELKMRRYRPSPASPFNEHGKPVLLFPGIVANMNQFILYTPEEREDDYAGMTLPEPLASWAEGDAAIEEDPMLYYSTAYYLWKMGYDPWFGNYRGTGRGEFESDRGSGYTNIDVWSALDAPAMVDTVRTVTGENPVIGGHSTGGLVAYTYMQGTIIDASEMGGDYIPHVQSDPDLAAKRNREVAGLLLLDPGGIPPLPKMIDQYAIWKAAGEPVYLDLDRLMEEIVNPLFKDSDFLMLTIDTLLKFINNKHALYQSFPDWLYVYELDIFGFLNFWIADNTDPCVEDFFVRYCAASTYLRGLAQYGDISLNNAIREHWKNGPENKDVVMGPEPARDLDGYYYYDDHMDLITVPAFAVLSDAGSLVDAQEIIDDFFMQKTAHSLDEWHQLANTAHLDITCGYTMPAVSYPLIGAWLSKLDGQNGRTTYENTGATDSAAGCGSAARAGGIGDMTHDSFNVELPVICSVLMLLLYIIKRRRRARRQRA